MKQRFITRSTSHYTLTFLTSLSYYYLHPADANSTSWLPDLAERNAALIYGQDP